jgi:ABC-2 type transport system ATP-binding protein
MALTAGLHVTLPPPRIAGWLTRIRLEKGNHPAIPGAGGRNSRGGRGGGVGDLTSVIGKSCGDAYAVETATEHPRGMSDVRIATDPATSDGEGVSLQGLVKSFGDVHAVRGVSLDIAPGETVALLGPNGAGKSTTIDMMLGLLKPDAGQVSLFSGTPSEAIARGAIGAMLQSGSLIIDLSVREYIHMLGSLYPQPLPVDSVIELAGLQDVTDRRTQKLSGGQVQRVRFAAALVSNPSLIVLDEPTVAMDVEARRRFWDAMRQFAQQGKTIVFATHYLEEADSYADRIVLMAHGRIVADGPTTEIKARVGRRVVRFTYADAHDADFTTIPGVASADVRGEAVTLSCTDSDAAIRYVVSRLERARDFEISGAGLEEAFLELTSDHTSDDTLPALQAGTLA